MTKQPTNASSQKGDTARTDTRRVRMAWFEHGTSRIYYEEQGSGTPVLPAASREQMVSLTARRLASPPGDDRPLPSVAAYDQLLGRESS